MGILTTDSVLGVFIFVIVMILGGAIGIGILAYVASELLRVVFAGYGDRDEELVQQGEES